MQHNFRQNSISHSFSVQEIIFQSVWPRELADSRKGNGFKMNLVDMFVLFLWKKFCVNDVIHSEKLNKCIRTTVKLKCAVLMQSSPLSLFQFLMASKLPKLLYVLHQQIVGLCICCEYFTYPRKDSCPWHAGNISSAFTTLAKHSPDSALRAIKRQNNPSNLYQ